MNRIDKYIILFWKNNSQRSFNFLHRRASSSPRTEDDNYQKDFAPVMALEKNQRETLRFRGQGFFSDYAHYLSVK